MNKALNVVTIDGPSGSGKSTVSRKLASRLGFTYLDTGAMYRTVALKCKISSINITDENKLESILNDVDINLLPAEDEKNDVRVFLDGHDVSQHIRSEEISMLASKVSALRSVRKKLTSMQRLIGSEGRIVAEGRDMGTFVFPQAAWKFFLDADPKERARRRSKQLRAQGKDVDETEVLRQIVERDQNDSHRAIAPLKMAEDALRIDTTNISPEETVESMITYIKRHQI